MCEIRFNVFYKSQFLNKIIILSLVLFLCYTDICQAIEVNHKYLLGFLKKNKIKVCYIQKKLIKSNLPTSFIVIPYIESRFNPNAVSKVGAKGIWQLMSKTAKKYGLRTSPLKDNRFNFILSTDTAIQYLKFLYYKFNKNIILTVAAYNCGEERVTKVLKKIGVRFTYKSFFKLIPKETRMYLKQFVFLSRTVKIKKHFCLNFSYKKRNYLMSVFNRKKIKDKDSTLNVIII